MTENSEPIKPDELISGQYKNREVLRNTITLFTKKIERECILMAPVLEPFLFNNADFIEALKHFVTSDRHNMAKIMIENHGQVIRENGRLITLCRKLSENLKLRSLPEEYQGHSDLFIVADKKSLLLQSNISTPEISVKLDDKTAVTPFVRRFDYAWQRSIPMPGLHTLGL